jgi:hypothetical protein
MTQPLLVLIALMLIALILSTRLQEAASRKTS